MIQKKEARKGVFKELPRNPRSELVLPWSTTLRMCWGNINNRRGRFVLVFVGISVVVAFFVSSFSSQEVIDRLLLYTDQVAERIDAAGGVTQADPDLVEKHVHYSAVLELAGHSGADKEALAKRRDQRIWLLTLSGILCLVGITNTMLMSVNERVREIGTLKCLGALDGFVVRLFMIESVFIGLVGSLIGGVFGLILMTLQLGFGLEWGMLPDGGLLQALFQGLGVALLSGTVLTVLAAIYPTLHAARMQAVDAMRVEF